MQIIISIYFGLMAVGFIIQAIFEGLENFKDSISVFTYYSEELKLEFGNYKQFKNKLLEFKILIINNNYISKYNKINIIKSLIEFDLYYQSTNLN